MSSKKMVVADTHLFHENVIIYCNRPFIDVADTNQCMINNGIVIERVVD